MRTFPVDSGAAWTSVASAVDQVRESCDRRSVDVAALKENKRGIDVTPEFLAHLTFNHCGDSVMKLMGFHPEVYKLNLSTRDSIAGQAKHCLGCMIANMRLGARAMYNYALAKAAEAAGESYHADVAGPFCPLGIGQAKYVLAVVDEYTRYLHVIPMRRMRQAASLLAQLFERIRVQVIRSKHAGVLRLHTDKGGELKSRDLESFCTWRGIVHTFTDIAAHQSNGIVERRMGLQNKGVRSCLLRSELPHYLWV